MAAGGAAAAAAAEAARRQMEEEEEQMTPYSQEELENDWEFKIVRANTGIFDKPRTFQKLIDEETRAGWQLLEKIDNSRVRFKRRRSARQRDAQLPPEVDPYRVHFGMSEGALAAWIVLAVIAVIGVLVLVISL